MFMIPSYADYIDNYIKERTKIDRPGEHHFVACYLLDRISFIAKRLPDYINPDGTKLLPGDIGYKATKYFSIEVKFVSVQLTAQQMKGNRKRTADLILAVDLTGLLLMPMRPFIQMYNRRKKAKYKYDKYGPSCNIDDFSKEELGLVGYRFEKPQAYDDYKDAELKFMAKLTDIVPDFSGSR